MSILQNNLPEPLFGPKLALHSIAPYIDTPHVDIASYVDGRFESIVINHMMFKNSPSRLWLYFQKTEKVSI